MKGIFNATWEVTKKGNAVGFELSDVVEMGGGCVPVAKTKSSHKIDVSDEIYDNEDSSAVLSLIKDYCAQNNIELADQFTKGRLSIN